MIRRISTKWVLSVLVAVVGPFVGFAWFVNVKVSDRMSGDVVRYHLLSMVADLSERVDEEIEERREDVALAARVPTVAWLIEGLAESDGIFKDSVEALFDELGVFDYVLAIDRDGRVGGANTAYPDGRPVPDRILNHLREQDYSEQPWFQRTLAEGADSIDFHRVDLSELAPSEEGADPREEGGWYVGWAHRIDGYDPGVEPKGVLMALLNWEHIQSVLSTYGVRQLAEEGMDHPVGEDIYESSYSWLWKSDSDTIIAHKNRDLYGQRVTELEGGRLSYLVDAAREGQWGMYPDYEFSGVTKKAAFKHCLGPEAGGFGWVVGVGVDDVDIYAPVRELSNWLFTTSGLILSLAIIISLFFAHRTTRPIRDLEAHTRRVGHGDLEARLEVRSRDELGQLARSFNRMVSELKENREQLVEAEKDAAWREMARQVAHEIKNPLTPISLSAGLLKRARDEKSPEFDAILDRTIEMIQRQVGNMQEVVKDFYTFAGEHRDPRRVNLSAVLEEVLSLSVAWASERGIRLQSPGAMPEAFVHADPDELQRAVLNLVSNAIEAMPDGGELHARIEVQGEEVVMELRDTGVGIQPDQQSRLFEPYFTTRSSGTGLGLAIVRRIVEDLGGTVSLENAPTGKGAIARVVLPRVE